MASFGPAASTAHERGEPVQARRDLAQDDKPSPKPANLLRIHIPPDSCASPEARGAARIPDGSAPGCTC